MKKMMSWLVMVMVTIMVLGALGAQAAEVNTPEMVGKLLALTQGSNVLYAGTMLAVSNGVVVPAADAAGQVVVGRCDRTSDNTLANYSATKTVTVRRGVFRWANGGSFTAADIGSFAYVQDAATVTTAGASVNKSIAGQIVLVDSLGVWVDTYVEGAQGSTSVSTLAVSGNASVGGTLAVTGASTLTGNTAVTGTLGVTGAATLSSTLAVTGTATFTNTTINGATVSMPHLPTATNGLASGRVWNNSGVLSVMP